MVKLLKTKSYKRITACTKGTETKYQEPEEKHEVKR